MYNFKIGFKIILFMSHDDNLIDYGLYFMIEIIILF
jgi:hypothetical protein